MDEKKIQKLQKMIDSHKKIVFFGGAGVSTESGIKDFRSVDGLYNQKYDYPPEEILSHSFFVRMPAEFYRFYYDKIISIDAEPNPAHKKLAELERAGKLTAVITQNIDGLHQKGGSVNVCELHGTVLKNTCTGCGKKFDVEYMRAPKGGIPRCDKCGAIIKPEVVLYEEGLDDDVIRRSIQAISDADMMIVGGPSLVVYPAAGLIDYFRGDTLVLINKGSTGREAGADLVITDPIGQVLDKIVVH